MQRLRRKNSLTEKKEVAETDVIIVPEPSPIPTPAVVQGELITSVNAPATSFSIKLITLVLKMILHGAISMRAAARISGLIHESVGGHRFDAMSHTTVQNYLLRVGLDQIENCNKTRLDRIWIMDHMIAAGALKCFVILGICADAFEQIDRPLRHEDVEVLTLIPTEVSNGAVVNDQLTELAKRRGTPLAILSDCGSDLKKGVELFQQDNPDTIALHDIVHLVCRLIWKRLNKEDRFSEYRQACCKCANVLRQSPLAHLKPPRPKTKARYMNVDPEIRWGRRALWLLDRVSAGNLTDRQKLRLDPQALEQQLGWLREYHRELTTWTELCRVGQNACSVVRRCGYASATPAILVEELSSIHSPLAKELVTEVVEVVTQQCDRCESHEGRLPGSSEVIESLIGKGKRLLGTSQNNNSLTGQILAIAASTAPLTESSLAESLARCRIKNLRDWIHNKIKPGIHTARKEDLLDSPNGTILAQAQVSAIPSF